MMCLDENNLLACCLLNVTERKCRWCLNKVFYELLILEVQVKQFVFQLTPESKVKYITF